MSVCLWVHAHYAAALLSAVATGLVSGVGIVKIIVATCPIDEPNEVRK